VTRRSRARLSPRKSVANLAAKIIRSPNLHLHDNVGIDKPGTASDKPCFM
jgi:hypothetical protein